MKLRDLLELEGNFCLTPGRLIIVSSYTGNEICDSANISGRFENTLDRRLDCEVEGLRSGIITEGAGDCVAQSAILIYVSDDDIVKEEEKFRSFKHREM